MSDLANFLTGGEHNRDRIYTEIDGLRQFQEQFQCPEADALLGEAITQIEAGALPAGDVALAKNIRRTAQERAKAIEIDYRQQLRAAAAVAGGNAIVEEDENAADWLSDIFESRGRSRRIGERNRASSAEAAGGDDELKHLRPDPKNSKRILKKDQNGNWRPAPKPSDFDEKWKLRHPNYNKKPQ